MKNERPSRLPEPVERAIDRAAFAGLGAVAGSELGAALTGESNTTGRLLCALGGLAIGALVPSLKSKLDNRGH